MSALRAWAARLPRIPHALLIGILMFAAWLRVYRLDGSSLWSDEGNTWRLIQRDWATIARDAAADIHPPGYYWLLKAWSLLVCGDAWGMRSFSALLGVVLVLVIYLLGRQVLPGRQGTVLGVSAAFVAAVNPFQVYYSQEARMYMLLTLAGAGLLWALLVWMGREGTPHPNPPLIGEGTGQPTMQSVLMGVGLSVVHRSSCPSPGLSRLAGWGCGRITAFRSCWRRRALPICGIGAGCGDKARM